MPSYHYLTNMRLCYRPQQPASTNVYSTYKNEKVIFFSEQDRNTPVFL